MFIVQERFKKKKKRRKRRKKEKETLLDQVLVVIQFGTPINVTL